VIAGAAVDADGALAPGTFEQETERAWRNVVSVAEAAGYSVEEILYVECVLADNGDYSALNDWWRRQFPDISKPRRDSTIQAGAPPFGAKIELQAVAGH
jgi:2-iminobutanoate/2-iminopropanoate deaminase